jgi:type II secretory pathway component PulM
MKIKRRRSGDYSIELYDWQREVLAALITQMRDLLLDGSSETLRRLYPTAYPDDAAANGAYNEIVHDQLLASRLDALDVLESQLDSDLVSADDLDEWLRALNSVRLVVGTRLDVSEEDDPSTIEDDDPDRDLWAVYHLLSEMLAVVVDALDR